MADVFSKEKRSEVMARVRGKDTKPEMTIRRALHARGFRFRLHRKDLPGKPDVILPKHRAVLFAHGCFWHGHDCELFTMPASREDFWRVKFDKNRQRDADVKEALLEMGWRVLVIWECALRGRGRLGIDAVIDGAAAWIESGSPNDEIRGN